MFRLKKTTNSILGFSVLINQFQRLRNGYLNVLLSALQMLINAGILFYLPKLFVDGNEVDAILMALSIPTYFLVIWTGSVGYQITPFIVKYSKNSLGDRDIANNLLILLIAIAIILFFLLYVFKGQIVSLFAPGFLGQKKDLTSRLLSLSLYLLPIQFTNAVLSNALIAIRQTVVSSFGYLLGYLTSFVFIFIFKGVITSDLFFDFLILGNLVTLFLFLYSYFSTNKYQRDFKNIQNGFLKQAIFLKSIFPVFLILLISRSINIIQNRYGSSMQSGTISLLTYTGYLSSAIITILITPILNFNYAKQCKMWQNGNFQTLFKFYRDVFSSIFLIAIVILCWLWNTKQFIQVVLDSFFRFDLFELKFAYVVLTFFAISCLIIAAFMARLFYIAEKFTTANFIDLAAIGIYIVFTKILSFKYEILGLYISYSLFAFFTVLLILVFLNRMLGFSLSEKLYITRKKIITAGLCVSIAFLGYLISQINIYVGVFANSIMAFYLGFKIIKKQSRVEL